MSVDEKVDLIIERLNLGKLDFLILNGIVLLAIMSLGVFVNSLFNPTAFTITNPLQLLVESMVACLFVPLLTYTYAYVTDSIRRRIFVVRIFLVYVTITILIGTFFSLQTLHNLLMVELSTYRSWIRFSEYVSYVTFPIFAVTVISLVYGLVSRGMGHWVISQIPKSAELERINFDRLLRPLPSVGRLSLKAAVGVAVAQLTVIDVIWALGLRHMISYGLWAAPLLLGWCFLMILTSAVIIRRKQLHQFLVRTTTRTAKRGKTL